MKLRTLINLLLYCCLSSISIVEAQTKKYKIGLSVWTGYSDSVKGFKSALGQAGFMEGKNVEYLYGKSNGDKNKQRDIIEGFKQARVDLVYSLTTPGTIIVKEVMPTDIPIVFSIVTYPADSGLIESFEYSGNNLVGTSNYVSLRYYLELLSTFLPQARRVAIFHRLGEPNSKIQAANMTRQLRRAGLDVVIKEVVDVSEVKIQALESAENVDLFVSTTDTLMQSGGEKALIDISLQHNVPILSSNKLGIEQGSTFGPVADFYTLGEMAGQKAVKILRDSVEPARIMSELQDPPLFLVNRNSFKQLGLTVPEKLPIKIKWIE